MQKREKWKKPKSYSSKRPGNQTLLNNLQKDLDELAQSEKDRDRAKMDQAVIDLKASVQKMSVNLDDLYREGREDEQKLGEPN